MATKKPNESEVKAKKEKKEDEELVSIMVPYVEGQDPEVTVIINGYVTKFRKGVPVKVKRNVAAVLADSNQQMMSAYENQKKFENQVMEI